MFACVDANQYLCNAMIILHEICCENKSKRMMIKRLLLVVAVCSMIGTINAQTKMEAENAQRTNCEVVNGED